MFKLDKAYKLCIVIVTNHLYVYINIFRAPLNIKMISQINRSGKLRD